MRTIGPLVGVLLVIGGCGGGSEPAAKPSPAKTTAAALAVSDETSCRQLFGNDEPMASATAMLLDYSQIEYLSEFKYTEAQVLDVADTLDRIGKRSSKDLRPPIDLIASRLGVIADVVADPREQGVDMDDAQAAGYEITSQCQDAG